MVPSTWLALLLFLFVISPGILFDLLEQRRRARYVESAFQETGRVVFGSIAFTALAVAILLFVRLAVPNWLPDPAGLITGGTAYLAEHYGLVFAAIAVELVLAHGAAVALHFILSAKSGGDTIRSVSIWSSVLKPKPKHHLVFVRLRLNDGVVYVGQVLHFSADLPLADREIALTRPLFSKTGTNRLAPMPDAYRFVVIRGADIHTMAVEHRRIAPRTPAAEPTEPVERPES